MAPTHGGGALVSVTGITTTGTPQPRPLTPLAVKHVRFIVAVLARRFRSRAVVELENLALRHQLHVLRRQRPGRPQLFAIDRLLWVWLRRLWPRCLDAMVLVKPATIVQ